jgi:hypothetical protein
MVPKLAKCFRQTLKNNILTCLSYVAGIDFTLWHRVRDCDFQIWLKRIVRKEVVCSYSSRIWKWLAYHKHYFAETISFAPPHECYMFLKTSRTKSNRVAADFLIFLSALPSFRYCHISSILLFPMIESYRVRERDGEPEDSSHLFLHRQMGIWSLLWAHIIIGSSAESCSGFEFR